MKTTISCTIDNSIRNYCSNFLSYLYAYNGWKRIMFETSKENYIPSNIEGENIRIVISNTGKILLTCNCVFDILKAIEYIIEQFKYGRMGYYIVIDDESSVKTVYTTILKFKDYYFDEEETCENEYGIIKMYKNNATLKYYKKDDGKELLEIFTSALIEDIKIYEDDKITEDDIKVDIENKKNNESEKFIFCFLFIYSLVKISELL